jgi:dethiobiotin synthetase
MSKGYFITGTDTGVGKTVVTALLASILRRQGLHVGVMKPVETGCPQDGDQLIPQDSLFLRQISGCTAPQELVTPYAFVEPLAPAIAAERAGVTIEMKHIRGCYEQLLAEHDIVLVEGAGGLLVPLTAQFTMHDIAVELDLPVLIVVCNRLGAINHAALTVSIARERSQVLGIVLNHIQAPDNDLAMQTNVDALRRWGKAPLLCQVPYMPIITAETLEALGQQLTLDGLFPFVPEHSWLSL